MKEDLGKSMVMVREVWGLGEWGSGVWGSGVWGSCGVWGSALGFGGGMGVWWVFQNVVRGVGWNVGEVR